MTNSPSTRPSLLMRLRNGQNQEAWCEFVELYGPVVFGFLRRRGVQDADAADLTQEVFRAVSGAISQFDYSPARGGFRNWLLVVTRNHLQSFHRRAARTPGTMDANWLANAEEFATDPATVESIWEDEWRREVLSRACDHVQAQVRKETWLAFERTAIFGHDPSTVASELNTTVSAVYLAKSRVLARLRKFIAELERE